MKQSTSIFRYNCRCGIADFFQLDTTAASCKHCSAQYHRSAEGVITFLQEISEQNAYFDKIYESGHSHARDMLNEGFVLDYQGTKETAETYWRLCGFDPARPVSNLSILDVACGTGWVTAGLSQIPTLRDSRFHAFDSSPQGPALLARFQQRQVPSSNLLEISVQDAEAMMFEDAAFDVIIGSSVLHHFDDYESFLGKCRRMLKSGGVATFGEPFAVGYGLGAAVLMMAQKQLGTRYKELETLYVDLTQRIRGSRSFLAGLVDKHLFLQSTFAEAARTAGFKSTEFVPLASRDFYRDHFIDELLSERNVSDSRLAAVAKDLYRIIFNIFDADTFGHTVGAFLQVVLRV